MELRLNGRHIIALNFLLIAGLAYFAARSVNDVVAMRLTPGEIPVSRTVSSLTDSASTRPRTAYQEIVNRDIFNLAPPPAPARAEAVEDLDLHLTLVGISTSTKGKPYAIIADRSGQQVVYRVGDSIADAGTLAEVDTDRVIVDHKGKRIALNLPKEEMPGPVVAAQPIEVPVADADDDSYDPNVEDLGNDHYKIPRATVDHSISNLSQLFTQIRAIPNIENGRTNGFALSEIEPGSVFDQMGLQEGDVLSSINGQQIRDPAQAMQMMSALRNQSQLNVQVLRDGSPTTLHYQIR